MNISISIRDQDGPQDGLTKKGKKFETIHVKTASSWQNSERVEGSEVKVMKLKVMKLKKVQMQQIV